MNQSLVRKQQLEYLSVVILVVSCVIFRFTINNIGIGYLLITLMFYEMLWVLFGYSFSNNIGRIILNRQSKGKFKSARVIWRQGSIMQLTTGLVVGIIIAFGLSAILKNQLGFTHSYYLAYFFGLAFLLRNISEVLAGYLASKGADGAIGFGALVRHICILVLGFLLSSAIKNYGIKVGDLLKQRDFGAVYGCLGVSISIVVAELLVIIFYMVLRLGVSRRNSYGYEDEYYQRNDSVSNVPMLIWKKRFVDFVNLILFFLPLMVAVFVCARTFENGIDFSENVGVFLSEVFAPVGFFIAIGYFLLLPLAAKVAVATKHKEHRKAKNILQTGFHLAFIYGSFGCAYLIAEGETLVNLMNEDNAQLISSLLIYGALLVVIGLVAAFCFKVLVLTGFGFVVMLAQVVSFGLFTLFLNIFLKNNMNPLLAAMISLLIYSVFNMLVYILLLIFKRGLYLDTVNGIFVPLVTGAIISVANIFLSKLIQPHLGSIFTAILTLIEMIFLYIIGLLLLRNFREYELEFVPGKKFIYALGQMLHVL